MFPETERLRMRPLTPADFDALCAILKDDETMNNYGGGFDDAMVHEWLDRQLAHYDRWGFGLWAVIRKDTGELIGQCGLTMQPWQDREVLEIGYLFRREFWQRSGAIPFAGGVFAIVRSAVSARRSRDVARGAGFAFRHDEVGGRSAGGGTRYFRQCAAARFRLFERIL